MSAVASLSLVASAVGVLPVSAAETQYKYVDVTADVNQSLAFEITVSDNANTPTTTCALGVLTTGDVNTCSYGLRIATNASAGWIAKFRAAGELTNGTDSIAHVTDGEVTAGVEEYGLAIASSTDGGYSGVNAYENPSIVSSPYNGTDQEIKTSTSTTAVHYNDPFDSHKGTASQVDTTLTVVTHRASVSVGTPEGHYTQRVWWEVTTSP